MTDGQDKRAAEMALPLEIRDQIASCFLYRDYHNFPGPSKYRIWGTDWDALVRLNPLRPSLDYPAPGPTTAPQLYKLKPDWETLGRLRLASRAWRVAVEDLMRRHAVLQVNLGRQTQLDALGGVLSPSFPVTRLVGQPPRQALPVTRHLIYSHCNDRWCMREGEEEEMINYHRDTELFDGRYQRPGDSDDGLVEKPFAREEHVETVDALLHRLPGLESLTLMLPESRADYSAHDVGSAGWYDLDVVEGYLSFFSTALASLPAFAHLTDLRLHLPCTHNVGRLCGDLDQDARDRLRHLEVCLVDATGVTGAREHLLNESLDPEDYREVNGDVYEPNTVPYGNLQRIGTNQDRQDDMWAFVGSCRCLESLCVAATNFLDLDRLRWDRAPGSSGLRVLALERVWVSHRSLRALIAPGSGPPALRRISLGDVKMKDGGGTWEEVCDDLRGNFGALELSCMDQLTYFEAHPRFFSGQRPWDTSMGISTSDEGDMMAMQALDDYLADKAGGWDAYPVHNRKN